jgi:hypothetical protein
MTSICFKPAETSARIELPLPHPDARAKNGGTPRISWRVACQDIVHLATGGGLNDLEGTLSVSVGDASPNGKTNFEQAPGEHWGVLDFFDWSNPHTFQVETYVSRDVFDRLVHLAEISRIPDCRV